MATPSNGIVDHPTKALATFYKTIIMCDSTAYVDVRRFREGSHANKVRDPHAFAVVFKVTLTLLLLSTYPRHGASYGRPRCPKRQNSA
ncbi:predicted protein [Chaetomium globosum CBS 148.51]|uniref:Uncharacterized protein n=1 Tax=Chaetomium globosum (strain ATCC 6205 / CBS 148.51 / DSM 1962 / NBRC 6347 / NRRL 1970) TaxID=306901 RepID=Q2GPE7_CHAGB|nr:uncharacterized protein CHGG_10157 [Chaetomium globosum CBS 148.51]EAQ83753.1 predicted protein [Chaetomium globosum CBS 148.51]